MTETRPPKKIYSAAFKKQVVKDSESGISIKDLANQYGINPCLVSAWRMHHGLIPSRKKHQPESVKQVVDLLLVGLSPKEISLQTKIPHGTVWNWAHKNKLSHRKITSDLYKYQLSTHPKPDTADSDQTAESLIKILMLQDSEKYSLIRLLFRAGK